MKSRLTRPGLTRSRLGAAIGVAVLLSVANPKPAQPGSAETPDSGEPAAESSASATEPGAPTKVVDALHENLISVMKDAETLGYDGRFERLEPVIGELFDIPFMAEKSIGQDKQEIGARAPLRSLRRF